MNRCEFCDFVYESGEEDGTYYLHLLDVHNVDRSETAITLLDYHTYCKVLRDVCAHQVGLRCPLADPDSMCLDDVNEHVIFLADDDILRFDVVWDEIFRRLEERQ